MTAERWQQIERLYHAALECDTHQRATFLDEACEGDASLRREVELLLAANDQATGFLGVPALELEAKEIAAEKVTARLTTVVGNSLNHYTVLSRIGAGGMGEVWLAQDTRLDRQVALKMLPVEFTADSHRLQRFIREAKAASALNHPNIITIHEIGEAVTAHGKTQFIATEFIAGQTLRQRMTENDWQMREAIDAAIQVAAALDAAHNAGIVHRDIKPENIMVRPDGLVKVLDFGLAKLAAPSGHSGDINTQAETAAPSLKTQPGMILGTLRYMSPEQARGRDVDARTDIFSLGVVLYEMISGQPLFAGDNSADVIAAIIHKDPPPLTNLVHDAPPELERIVTKALAKDCRDRYQTARDLQIDLRHLKQESEISARIARSEYASAFGSRAALAARQPNKPRFMLRRVMVISPVAILLLGLLWWFTSHNRRHVQTLPPALLKTAEVFTWQSASGEVYSVGAFSPDGKWVAFTSTEGGSKNIRIKQSKSGDPEPSTKDEFQNENPIWSPNGEEIAFVSLRGDQPGIWHKPPFGGSSVLVKAFPRDDFGLKLKQWSKDGEVIYYESNKNLYTVAIGSGHTRQLTALTSTAVISDTLSVAPDELRIAYITADSDGYYGIWTMPLSGDVPTQLLRLPFPARNTVWHPDGNRLLFSSKVDGTYQIFALDIKNRQPAQVTVGEKDCLVLDVSADGSKVLYGSSKEDSDIWAIDAALAAETPISSDISFELWPDVSPDSKTIAYQAINNLSQGNKILNGSILVKAPELAAKPTHLVKEGALPKWSPDGRHLAFVQSKEKRINLWAVNPGSGEEKLLSNGRSLSVDYLALPYNRYQTSSFAWSPDSQRIAYAASGGNISNLWLTASDGSTDTRLTNNNNPNLFFYCPLWSADGKLLAYSSTDYSQGLKVFRLWLFDLNSHDAKKLYESNSLARMIGWLQADQELVLATPKSKLGSGQITDVELLRVSAKTGVTNVIAVLPSAYFYNLHLSPGRRTIAFTARPDGKDNVWLIPVNGGRPREMSRNNDPRLYFSTLAWSPDNQRIYFGKQLRYSQLAMIPNFE